MDLLLSMRVFARIVESGSMTRASDSTRLSQSRVSSLLGALEQHLGCKLLHRTTRRLSLTDVGKSYYARCVAVLAEIDEMETSVTIDRDSPRGHLKANLPTSMAKEIVIPALPEFLAAYPDITVDLGITDRQIDLVSEGIDCVVRFGALDDSAMVARRIGSLTICTCASAAYLDAYGVPESIDDLSHHVGVCHVSADTGRPHAWHFVVDGDPRVVQIRSSIAVNDADSYIACGLSGLGLIRTSLHFVAQHIHAGRLREVLIEHSPAPQPISILYPSNRHVPAKLKLFTDWLADLCARTPTLQGKRY